MAFIAAPNRGSIVSQEQVEAARKRSAPTQSPTQSSPSQYLSPDDLQAKIAKENAAYMAALSGAGQASGSAGVVPARGSGVSGAVGGGGVGSAAMAGLNKVVTPPPTADAAAGAMPSGTGVGGEGSAPGFQMSGGGMLRPLGRRSYPVHSMALAGLRSVY